MRKRELDIANKKKKVALTEESKMLKAIPTTLLVTSTGQVLSHKNVRGYTSVSLCH